MTDRFDEAGHELMIRVRGYPGQLDGEVSAVCAAALRAERERTKQECATAVEHADDMSRASGDFRYGSSRLGTLAAAIRALP